jgi:hypothetical protein
MPVVNVMTAPPKQNSVPFNLQKAGHAGQPATAAEKSFPD